MDWNRIRDELIACRDAAGLNQIELAELTGIDKSTVSRIENGLTRPTLETINSWVTATDVALWTFFARVAGQAVNVSNDALPALQEEEGITPTEAATLRAIGKVFAKYAQPSRAEARALDPGSAPGHRNEIPEDNFQNRATRRRRHRRRATKRSLDEKK